MRKPKSYKQVSRKFQLRLSHAFTNSNLYAILAIIFFLFCFLHAMNYFLEDACVIKGYEDNFNKINNNLITMLL